MDMPKRRPAPGERRGDTVAMRYGHAVKSGFRPEIVEIEEAKAASHDRFFGRMP
jgi:hypothetical protein